MKVVVIGLDGAGPQLVLQGIKRGDLPAFAHMMREGTWGVLRSTMPPDSPSAWGSFATGVNPGRHGVFGFMARRTRDYGYEIGSSSSLRAPTLWELAGRQDVRVGVLNVPFTYPPRSVNGFLVAGMMTPDLRSSFTHPPELRRALLRAIPDYSISHGLGRMQGSDPRAVLVRQFASTISMRERAMRWLASKYDPDMLICVFTVLDRLQHFLWADMDEHHPAHDGDAPRERREAIREAYVLLDGVIARTLEAADDQTLVVVMSDHGFQGVGRTFYVNAWLAEHGLLALTGRSAEPGAWTGRVARVARKALSSIPAAGGRVRERLRARRLISHAFVRAIDWSRTRVWFGLDRGLWINVEGREPLGGVKPGAEYERLCAQLITELEALGDPQTGRRVVGKVYRREEIYQGEAVAGAPDLMIEPARDPRDAARRYILSERIGACDRGQFVGPSSPISGNHTPDGVLLAWGAGVRRRGQVTDASIVDIAPTILSCMGLAGWEEMDGRPLPILDQAPPSALLPKKAARQEGSREKDAAPITDRDRQRLEQQLRDLGYLD